MAYENKQNLKIVYGDVTLGVHGEDFHLIRQEVWSLW